MNMSWRTTKPIIPNLYRNFNENIRLEETLDEIKNKIAEIKDERIKENLRHWEKRYKLKISLPKELGEAINVKGLDIQENVLRDYIYNNGLFYKDLKITEFEKEKYIDVGYIDLFGLTKENKYIIELKKGYVGHKTIGQVLSYYQYLKDRFGQLYPVIVIGRHFRESYRLACKAVVGAGLDVLSLEFFIDENGLYYKEI